MRRLYFVLVVGLALAACNKKAERSTATGWNYNDKDWGGFVKATSENQTIGPNLVPIEGGVFTMGIVDEDVMYDYNNLPKRVTVNSFFMDETEVSNLQYREYVYWVDRIVGADYPGIVKMVRPDTLVWRDELAYNEPMVENYFSYPAFNEYPVVGVNWDQANDYARWRSDRVNEMLLRRRGIIEFDQGQTAGSSFNTEAYLLGRYDVADGPNPVEDLDPNGDGTRKVTRADGILLPAYRLPTEAEWEYAALGMRGNLIEGTEINEQRRLYPHDGTSLRAQKGRDQGKFLYNFKRG
ncbi:MAG: formylglycine-generating enzyme family protein, partial [Saprospiraceae bacterium]|nr:formylglycine-generating enzyme family protein [Saprospiraceae bacterium]